jgi:hypothetical protein
MIPIPPKAMGMSNEVVLVTKRRPKKQMKGGNRNRNCVSRKKRNSSKYRKYSKMVTPTAQKKRFPFQRHHRLK